MSRIVSKRPRARMSSGPELLARASLKRWQAIEREQQGKAIDRLVRKEGDALCHGNERILDLTDADAAAWIGGAV
ncbi:MAG: hypothetical protein K8T25_18070 [Planctomycetia bacterium]|nr:hypothetical protein [Planctomycetia bacterium]